MAVPIDAGPPVALAATIFVCSMLSRWIPQHSKAILSFSAIIKLLLAIQLLDLFIGAIIIPATLISNSIPKEQLKLGDQWRQVITNPDGNSTARIQIGLCEPFPGQNWVVFIPPNGARFEQLSEYLETHGKNIGRNVLAFNFRGVGESSGWPRKADDLVDDGITATKYLIESLGVSHEQILFHGWSLGGHVAVKLKQQYPESCLVHDRSFRSISKVAESMLANEIGLGGILGSFTFAMIGILIPSMSSMGVLGFAVAGAALGASGAIAPLALPVLRFLNWEMDSIEAWNAAECSSDSKCIILYHKEDGIIPYQESSLHVAVQESHSGDEPFSAKLVELTASYPSKHQNHLYPLVMYTPQYRELVTVIKGVCD